MAINFTFSHGGTSRFAQVVGSSAPKFPAGKTKLRWFQSVLRQSVVRLAVVIALIAGFCVIFSSPVFACAELPKTEPKTSWETFRRTFPYHIQGVAYDQRSGDLIISEPPPHVTFKKFQEMFPELTQLEVKETPVGCDGWVKDIVAQVPPMEEPKRRDLFDRINLYLFHTTYKADVLNLPARRANLDNTDLPLDVTVTSADLNDWLLNKNESFESVVTGEQMAFSEIVSQKKSGVYFSDAPGLIIWAIDRKKSLDNYSAEARQFTVDADLIVGAVSDAEMLVIAGRKRILPLDAFPPLRTETILQLAAVKNADLAQSYERKYPFAGKFNDKDDWAPIYLSDELIDTEYGSLLNITDQILKSWSQAGTVSYINFDDYQKPKTFPFGDKTLNEYLNLGSVTFNWNTFGVGYASEIKGKRIFAINRTGALPTSYLGEQEDNYSEAEEKGYKYFAEIGDPNLTRVVQYAALYQIFQDSPVSIKKTADTPKYTPDTTSLYEELLKKILMIKMLPDEDVAEMKTDKDFKEFADAVTTIKAFNNFEEIEAAAKSVLDPRNSNNQTNQKYVQYEAAKNAVLRELRLLQGLYDSKLVARNRVTVNFNNTCVPRGEAVRCNGLISTRNRLDNELAQLSNTYLTRSGKLGELDRTFGIYVDFSDALNKAFSFLSRYNSSLAPEEINRMKEIYLASLPKRESNWIHTPSIVVSSSNKLKAIGGHNLAAKITTFRTGNVPAGKVLISRIGGKQVITTNAGDIGKVSSLVRKAGARGGNADLNALKFNLERELISKPVTIPKPQSSALKFPAAPRAIKRSSEKIGWDSTGKINAIEDDVVTITKLDNGSEDIFYRQRKITADTPTSRNDYISSIKYGGKDPARIRMIGFSADEAKALKTSLSIRTSPGERTGIIRLIKDFGTGKTRLVKDYNFSNASISPPQFEVIGSGVGAKTRATIDLVIPRSSPASSGLSLRIVKIFKGVVSKVREQQITQRLTALFNHKFKTQPYAAETDVNLVMTEIRNEIKAEFPDVQEVKFFSYDDITVSDNLKLDKDDDTYAE
jgi:hypothetical protein